jgi:hypothetical protein
VNDTHLQILRDLARHRARCLNAHRARAGETSARASSRREDLERLAARARTRLAAAEARRRVARDEA